MSTKGLAMGIRRVWNNLREGVFQGLMILLIIAVIVALLWPYSDPPATKKNQAKTNPTLKLLK